MPTSRRGKDIEPLAETSIVDAEMVDDGPALQDVSALVPAREKTPAGTERDSIVPELYRSDAYGIEELQDAASFQDFIALAESKYGNIDDVAHTLGDGFTVLKREEKGRLVGVPLVFLEWNFYQGEFGGNFVAARVVVLNQDGSVGKYIVNDGSTGIADMLAEYTKRTGRTGALKARKGLSESQYTYCNECGKAVQPTRDTEHRDIPGAHINASTYYIDTSV